MKKTILSSTWLAAGLLLIFPVQSPAQWITQSFSLKSGWNAVYLHVDASYTTLWDLIGTDSSNPIQEIWLWNPAPDSLQFILTPQLPTGSSSQWLSWSRDLGPASALPRLTANAAYLVRVSTNVTDYTWNLKGKPVPPRYNWTTTGLNLVGFPTWLPTAPSFETFLGQEPELLEKAQVFQYVGGDLGPSNPIPLYALRTTPVRRGEAFWIRSGDFFNRYFGPFELELQDAKGVDFRDSAGQYRIRARNLTANDLVVTLTLQPSETAPTGQQTIVQAPLLLLRGEQNLANLTYAYGKLADGPQSWTLKPKGQTGSEVEIVLGVNRFQMPGNAGDLYAGVLQFTDSLNLSRVDVPVSATVASQAGLWIGQASIQQVRQYLKNYAQDANGQIAQSTNGQYVVSGVNTNYGKVARSFPMRLILHQDANGTDTVMLQRVYYGYDLGSNLVVTTKESLLDPKRLDGAKRISAVHLPWSESNNPWTCSGALQEGTNLTATVTLAYDDQASNPFLHTYHPDHDNLDAAFEAPLPRGQESYSVVRQITLTINSPQDDFASLTGSSQNLVGQYEETVTVQGKGSQSRHFDVSGVFFLNRITDIPHLTRD